MKKVPLIHTSLSYIYKQDFLEATFAPEALFGGNPIIFFGELAETLQQKTQVLSKLFNDTLVINFIDYKTGKDNVFITKYSTGAHVYKTNQSVVIRKMEIKGVFNSFCHHNLVSTINKGGFELVRLSIAKKESNETNIDRILRTPSLSEFLKPEQPVSLFFRAIVYCNLLFTPDLIMDFYLRDEQEENRAVYSIFYEEP